MYAMTGKENRPSVMKSDTHEH